MFLIIMIKFIEYCDSQLLRRTTITASISEVQTINSSLLTVKEVARMLRVDDTTVRRWVKQGVFEAINLPHANKHQSYRIKRQTIENLFNKEQTNVHHENTHHVHTTN